jgi:hypothetical protein
VISTRAAYRPSATGASTTDNPRAFRW